MPYPAVHTFSVGHTYPLAWHHRTHWLLPGQISAMSSLLERGTQQHIQLFQSSRSGPAFFSTGFDEIFVVVFYRVKGIGDTVYILNIVFTTQCYAIHQHWTFRLMLIANCIQSSIIACFWGNSGSIFIALSTIDSATLMYSSVVGNTVSCDFKQQPGVPSHAEVSVYANSSTAFPSAHTTGILAW